MAHAGHDRQNLGEGACQSRGSFSTESSLVGQALLVGLEVDMPLLDHDGVVGHVGLEYPQGQTHLKSSPMACSFRPISLLYLLKISRA